MKKSPHCGIRDFVVSLLLVASGFGCVTELGRDGLGVEEDDFGDEPAYIIDGTPHDGDHATVGRFGCTGSLFHARLVLAAAHCIPDGGARSLSIGVGPRADGSSRYAEVTEVLLPDSRGGSGGDIAILVLDAAGASRRTPCLSSLPRSEIGSWESVTGKPMALAEVSPRVRGFAASRRWAASAVERSSPRARFPVTATAAVRSSTRSVV